LQKNRVKKSGLVGEEATGPALKTDSEIALFSSRCAQASTGAMFGRAKTCAQAAKQRGQMGKNVMHGLGAFHTRLAISLRLGNQGLPYALNE
jgi:hypothetical protein